MNFELSDNQAAVQESIRRICKGFGDEYWTSCDASGQFPSEFYRALASGGWLGICTAPEFGGAGLGMQEAAVMMRNVSESGAGMSGSSAVHINIFGLHPVTVYGTQEQKERMLRPMVEGRVKACFAVTEPDTGLNTTRLKVKALKSGDKYLVNGQKVWISTAQQADNVLLLARTTPLQDISKPSDGLSLFYTRLDRSRVRVVEIDKMGRSAVDSNELFFEDYEIPEEDLIGEEGNGFKQILHGFNPERILIAAEAIGLGMVAIERAANYAKERNVFDRPIGQNQSIQHPLAVCRSELEAAWLTTMKAAWEYDTGASSGASANMAKYLAGEAAFNACQTAVMTHGGFGYAKEYQVERYLRESFIPRIAPVSPQLALCFIAEKVLGLPKSY